jgi:3-methyladenine DNA glycosylase/8-oxoguanine DNA glycosylase
MLFAMKQTGIFPIDVWVRRVMSRFYGMGEDNVSAMKEYAERNFGEYGGIAQQYLFYYIRNLARGNRTLYDKLEMGPEAEPLYFNNLD